MRRHPGLPRTCQATLLCVPSSWRSRLPRPNASKTLMSDTGDRARAPAAFPGLGKWRRRSKAGARVQGRERR